MCVCVYALPSGLRSSAPFSSPEGGGEGVTWREEIYREKRMNLMIYTHISNANKRCDGRELPRTFFSLRGLPGLVGLLDFTIEVGSSVTSPPERRT